MSFFSLFQSNKSPEIMAPKSPPLWSVFHLGKKRLKEKMFAQYPRDIYKLFFQETLLQTSYTGPMLWLTIGTTNNWSGQKQESSWRIRGEVRICGCPKGHWYSERPLSFAWSCKHLYYIWHGFLYRFLWVAYRFVWFGATQHFGWSLGDDLQERKWRDFILWRNHVQFYGM